MRGGTGRHGAAPREPLSRMLRAMSGVLSVAILVAVFAAIAVAAGWVAVRLHRAGSPR